MTRALALVAGCFVAYMSLAISTAFSADTTKKDALKSDSAKTDSGTETLMCERGKLLLSDDLNQPLGKQWKAAKGKWEVVGGAMQGSELKADMHGAVMRTNVPVKNAVIQYSFKLQGAKSTSLSINDAKGHNSRVLITPAGFSARKDDHDHEGPDKAVLLQAVKTPIAADEWHTLVVEIQGPEFVARLDGKEVALGSHEAINVDKTNFGLTVAGESVSFKNLRIWEATPKADWAATKAKLTAVSK